ncbi:MAG: hypothetical protein ACERLB_17525, partial [Gammaproteobacteria bacterium]
VEVVEVAHDLALEAEEQQPQGRQKNGRPPEDPARQRERLGIQAHLKPPPRFSLSPFSPRQGTTGCSPRIVFQRESP